MFEAFGLGDDLPVDHIDHYYRLSWRRAENGSVAVSSSGVTGDGWQPIDPETAVRVDIATLEVSLRDLQTHTFMPAA